LIERGQKARAHGTIRRVPMLRLYSFGLFPNGALSEMKTRRRVVEAFKRFA